MSNISRKLKNHYENTFNDFGPTVKGVDWGNKNENLFIRYEKMISVINEKLKKQKILDVGCGYCGLYQYLLEKNIKIDYTGIDIAKNMIDWTKNNIKGIKLINGDFLSYQFKQSNYYYDYVICNGILTQKLNNSNIEMEAYAKKLIKKMFKLTRHGIAFNIMTTKVNYFSNNLFYKNPCEMLSWCIDEISPYVKLDHSYPLYEYTVYVYRQPLG